MIINWQEEITKIDPDIKFRAQVRLLDMVIDAGQGWAVDLWDAVEDEF